MIYLTTLVLVGLGFGLFASANLRNPFLWGIIGGAIYFVSLTFVRIFSPRFLPSDMLFPLSSADYYELVFVTIFIALIISLVVHFIILNIVQLFTGN